MKRKPTPPGLPKIAIVGIGCEYPDARSPMELWENVLAQRRSFRKLPPERLRAEDYYSGDPAAPDRTYAIQAALIEGYEFDRVRFRVAGSTFRAADLTHWLALDVASRALADAGFEDGENLPRETTGVLLGNTLTGEFSRAALMRLRWPYVRRVVGAALKERDWTAEELQQFLAELENSYKAPFAPVGEETLAGGLSNTIAGRICNYYDLKGGGYTIDGACSSSLLAVATACTGLISGDLDVALAGGVDLSLDPFEIVGFAKTSALSAGEMHVYDARSAGFWPGEGCGFVVLMRHDDAVAQNRRIYATVQGWGISSDGSGGITRPEIEGQILAIRRGYRTAGFGIDTVGYIEGHGTGTAVGDETELRVLAAARREAGGATAPAVVGSIKANIGHTKAAAGVAGLIKATMALQQQIIPPTTASEIPHPVLVEEASVLRTAATAETWPADLPLRAGVSSMGFGGINAHVVLEGIATRRRRGLGPREEGLASSGQDAELFLFRGAAPDALAQLIEKLERRAPSLSRADLADLAAALERSLDPGALRAAVVASSPEELAARLASLRGWLGEGETARLEPSSGLFLGSGEETPRLGFLFPGQGSPSRRDCGAAQRRFRVVRDLYATVTFPEGGDDVWTAIAQPAIAAASLAALRILGRLGISADIALGHSLGELTALQWGGAFDEATLLRIAAARGEAMATAGRRDGAMGSIGAAADRVEPLLEGEPVVISGLNTPAQTTISGEAAAVERIVARAKAEGLQAVRLKVSHAFHSPLMEQVVPVLNACLSQERFAPLRRTVVSTVTGSRLGPDDDLRSLLCRQVLEPVRFVEAVACASDVELLIEVGPGRVLTGLAAQSARCPVIATDVGGSSLAGLLDAVAAAFVLGAPVEHRALFEDRISRPFDWDREGRFFVNPCELAPDAGGSVPLPAATQRGEGSARAADPAISAGVSPKIVRTIRSSGDVLELVRELVAQRVELPAAAVKDDHRLLDDLHLNSIVVGQLVTEAAASLGLAPVVAPTEFADATVGEVARALDELVRTGEGSADRELDRLPPGIAPWLRRFTVELSEHAIGAPREALGGGTWRIFSLPDDPAARAIEQKLNEWGREGVAVCLPPDSDQDAIRLLLSGAREVLDRREPTRFVLLQHGRGAAAFARSLHLEARELTTTVVDAPSGHPGTADWVCAETAATIGFSEAHYDARGRRREPVLRLLAGCEAADPPVLGSGDVLVVTGGGKGIASECALDLAKHTGVRLMLLGRSDPGTDDRLAANLERMRSAGVRFEYRATDVTDPRDVSAAIRRAEETLGPVTAILHAAGSNTPRLIRSLDQEAVRQTYAPKVEGARNILSACDPNRLRLFLTFGSILARIGMRGEADYALANEWLRDLTERFAQEHPHCRCLALEWSLWSGVGMGERLGRVEALIREGVTPITVDQGVQTLRDLLGRQLPRTSVIVTGRFGEAPTLRMERAALPFWRFLERPSVNYPGVELVTEADLTSEADPYIDDHVFQGSKIVPAVVGLEAMAQVAAALMGETNLPIFERIEFSRPVTVPSDAARTVRVASLATEPGAVEVALRSAETSFQADHFRATCRFDRPREAEARIGRDEESRPESVPLDPQKDLYDDLLFQDGRFRRVHRYRLLQATECEAELRPGEAASWFGPYLPSELLLGDPGARDAAIHSIQACIPHARILPVGIDRLYPGRLPADAALIVRARERARSRETYTYDLEIVAADGALLERWEGLRLRVVEERRQIQPWVVPLLAPYLERRIGELLPGSRTRVALAAGGKRKERRSSDPVIRQAIGRNAEILRRPDGKPEAGGNLHVSAARAAGLVLAVADPHRVGCDMESIEPRPSSVWRDLLGDERCGLAELVAREASEDFDAAATRVWAAAECLKKIGEPVKSPLVLAAAGSDGWVVLSSGSMVAATYLASVRDRQDRLTFAVLCEPDLGRHDRSSAGGSDASV